MARLIVDTSSLIELERRGVRTASGTAGLPEGDFAIASVTVSELMVGVYRADLSRRRNLREAFVMSVIERCLVLPFDLDAAYVHARLETDLAAGGQRIGFYDLIIAATAIVHDCEVITHNVREFQRVPGLTVRSIDW